MCNQCYCENELKCSIKGYHPPGWCCEFCEKRVPGMICESQLIEVTGSAKVTGYCLGCNQVHVLLKWVHFESPQGFCHKCIAKYSKQDLLNIVVKSTLKKADFQKKSE
jgi:hypothetical protein